MPGNFKPADPENPFADYSVEQLYQFLSTYQLTRDVGAMYEYSNLGAGLLGHILGLRAGMDYESLVKTRITGPLDMTSTTVMLSAPMQARLAPGHDRMLHPTKNWDLTSLAGRGGTPIVRERHADVSCRGDGLHAIGSRAGDEGHAPVPSSSDPEARTGVVVLMNAVSLAGGDDIGRHLLDPKAALLPAYSPALVQPKPRTEISLSPNIFDRYVGRYEFSPTAPPFITRDGDRFMAQLGGQAAAQIFAETEKDFFYRAVDAQLTFETDANGKVVAVVLHQNGLTPRAMRAN